MDYGVLSAGYVPGLRVELVTPPAVEPATVDEVKAWARIQHAADDAMIADLIAACRGRIEADLKRALITQTRAVWMGGWPSTFGAIKIPYPPLQSIVSVQYTDISNVTQTIDPSLYLSNTDATPGRLWLPIGRAWPVEGPYPDAIKITYVCGYGPTAADVPMTIRMALRALVAANYATREAYGIIQGGQMLATPMYEAFLRAEAYGDYL